MDIKQQLLERSQSACEFCGQKEELRVFAVPPFSEEEADKCAMVCSVCEAQIDESEDLNADHWRCLNESIWVPVPPVQVLAWRMLQRLDTEAWAQDLAGQMYMDEETATWAQEGGAEVALVHKDSNGHILENGDSVVLIKDLNVKGANFIAKRGTAVRRISLVADNPEHIEGRVNDQHIVILTKFVKKS